MARRYGRLGSGAWDSPIYRTFYDQMRVLNQSMPDHPLRVWLGDALGAGPATAAWPDRDAHGADVVERVAFAEHRRVLVVAGGGHGLATSLRPSAPRSSGWRRAIRAPSRCCCHVWSGTTSGTDVRTMPPPSIASPPGGGRRWLLRSPIRGSPALTVGCCSATSRALTPCGGRVVVPLRFYDKVGSEVRDLPLHALADAIVYFGPGRSLVYVRPDERRAPR